MRAAIAIGWRMRAGIGIGWRMRAGIAIGLLVSACTTSGMHMMGDDDDDDVQPIDCKTGTFRSQTLVTGDGLEDRSYWLHVPASYDCKAPAPLLVDFHGTAGDMPEEAYQTEALVAFSEAQRVIVVRPRSRFSLFNGSPIYRWDQNMGDLPRNVTFAKNLVADLEARYPIDAERVYASGFSSGSNMVAQFLSDPASPFKGIAPIAGGKWTANPLPSLSNGPRIYDATGYRDYLWPYARSFTKAVAAAGLPADRLLLRRTGGGHDLYAWHFDELFAFLDGGVRPGGEAIDPAWTVSTLPSPADVNALARDGSDLVAAGANGRVWRRPASGTWQVELDRGTADFTALCFGGTTGFVGGNYVGAVHGSTWSADLTVPDYGQLGAGWVNGATCRGDGSIVVAGYWSAAITANAGGQWAQFGVPSGFGYENQIAGIAEVPGGATVAVGYYDYVGTAQPGSTTASPVAQHGGSAEWWNAVAAVSGGKVWVVGDGGLIAASSNNGVSWSAQVSGTTENLYAVHFADAQHGAAVGRRGSVVVTADGGAHWTPRSIGRDAYLGAVYVDATTITIAGEDGLVASSPR